MTQTQVASCDRCGGRLTRRYDTEPLHCLACGRYLWDSMDTKRQFLQADGVSHDYLYTSKAQRGAPTERTRGARKGVVTWRRVLRWGTLTRSPFYCRWPGCISRVSYHAVCRKHFMEYFAAFDEEPHRWKDMALRSEAGAVVVRYWQSNGNAVVSEIKAPPSFFNSGSKAFRTRGVDALREAFHADTGLRLWGLGAALKEAQK